MISRSVISAVRGAVTSAAQDGLTGSFDSPYEPETAGLLARMSVEPSITRKGHINTLIAALKTAGVWAKMDAFYVFAAHDAQAALLDWTGRGNDLATVGSVTFTTDRGFTGDGATGYLTKASWTPALQTQNDAHLSVWTRTAATYDGVTGKLDAHTGSARLGRRATTDSAAYTWRINDATGTQSAPAAQTGHFLCARAVAGTKRLYRNGASVATASVASTATATRIDFLSNAGASLFSDAQISAGSVGQNPTDTEASDFYTALAAWQTAVGA